MSTIRKIAFVIITAVVIIAAAVTAYSVSPDATSAPNASAAEVELLTRELAVQRVKDANEVFHVISYGYVWADLSQPLRGPDNRTVCPVNDGQTIDDYRSLAESSYTTEIAEMLLQQELISKRFTTLNGQLCIIPEGRQNVAYPYNPDSIEASLNIISASDTQAVVTVDTEIIASSIYERNTIEPLKIHLSLENGRWKVSDVDYSAFIFHADLDALASDTLTIDVAKALVIGAVHDIYYYYNMGSSMDWGLEVFEFEDILGIGNLTYQKFPKGVDTGNVWNDYIRKLCEGDVLRKLMASNLNVIEYDGTMYGCDLRKNAVDSGLFEVSPQDSQFTISVYDTGMHGTIHYVMPYTVPSTKDGQGPYTQEQITLSFYVHRPLIWTGGDWTEDVWSEDFLLDDNWSRGDWIIYDGDFIEKLNEMYQTSIIMVLAAQRAGRKTDVQIVPYVERLPSILPTPTIPVEIETTPTATSPSPTPRVTLSYEQPTPSPAPESSVDVVNTDDNNSSRNKEAIFIGCMIALIVIAAVVAVVALTYKGKDNA